MGGSLVWKCVQCTYIGFPPPTFSPLTNSSGWQKPDMKERGDVAFSWDNAQPHRHHITLPLMVHLNTSMIHSWSVVISMIRARCVSWSQCVITLDQMLPSMSVENTRNHIFLFYLPDIRLDCQLVTFRFQLQFTRWNGSRPCDYFLAVD